MTWVRLDDQFPENLKVEEAGVPAAWLYVAALCLCSRQLTDGRVPKSMVPRLTSIKKPERGAQRLVEAGLWEDRDDHFFITDFLEFNPSREQVTARREARAAAGSKGGSKRQAKRQANAKANGSGVASSAGEPPTPPPPPEVKEILSPPPSSVGGDGDKIATRLKAKGHSPEDIDLVIERLLDRKLSPNPVTDEVAWCEKLLSNLALERGRQERVDEPLVVEVEGEKMALEDGHWVAMPS